MNSLRARLVFGLVAVAGAGMIVLAAVVYAEQRSYQYDRVDDQVNAALPSISRAIEEQGVNVPGDGGGGPRPGPRRDGPGGGGPPVSLPPGTYGELRDASGQSLGEVSLSFGDAAATEPNLPDDLDPGEIITVDAAGGSDEQFRVKATPLPGGGSVVVAVPLTDANETLERLLLVEAIVVAAVLAVLGGVSLIVVRIGLRPLDRIGETASAIAAGDRSRRVEETDERTEVGRLGTSLNTMLDSLDSAYAAREASEERLRQFIADASHELRTPLASIRGYAELFGMGAAADPEEVARAMERIEAEAMRMGVLVEDLLALARLDEARERPHERVDVGALAGDAVGDARAVAPDRDIALTASEGVAVMGDRDQLQQVLGNLVRNAITHTPDGTPIEVGVDNGDRANVVVTVRDHGPGLPEGASEALFERFWRAERGRERGKAGAGLGLAIVAAIVDAHGGTVEGRDADGGGARFTVRLPAA